MNLGYEIEKSEKEIVKLFTTRDRAYFFSRGLAVGDILIACVKMFDLRKKMVVALALAFACAASARVIDIDLSGQSGRVASSLSLSPSDPEEIRSHRLEAGAAKVSGLEVGDVIAFKLFADKTLEVELVEETESLSGRAFLGRIDNALDAIGCVVLETEAGIILDVTDFENHRVWKVVSDVNGVSVREIKPDNTRRQGSDTLYRPTGQTSVNVSNVSAATLAAVSTETTVDILVNYDTDAATWAKSNGGGLQTFAETCVQKMNTALANTGLTSYFRFRLVGIYEVGGSAKGDIEYALYYASGYYSGTLNGVSWAGVEAERDRVGADIVCTLCDSGSAYGVVGIGWALMSYSNSASCGFNACQIRSVANSHTMTHEVGHNMGAGHSDAQTSSPGPQYYTYSSGYYFTAGGTKYHTIMAYNSDGKGNYYNEAPYFSSPSHKYNGVIVGTTSKNDNTRTLRENWQKVAENRIAGDVDDDYPPVVQVDLPTALDNSALSFTTGGTSSWYGQTEQTWDGVDAARSGDLGNNQTNYLQTVVSGAGTISFKWYVSSENNYDWLEFLVDGTVKERISGTGNAWTSKSFSISTAGSHTLKWRYSKDVSMDYGDDAGYVDQVTWTPARPAYTIRFNRMDYSGATFEHVLHEGTSGCLPTLEDIGWSYSGHYFMGWTTRIYNPALEPAAIVDFVDGATVKDLAPAGGTVTLYAVWSASPPKSIPSISSSASSTTVNNTIDGIGFADADVKRTIGGKASEYLAFRSWALGMTGGEAAVALSPHAAAAYLMGARSLFGYAPSIMLAPLDAGSGSGSGMAVAVAVNDGERLVDVDAAKIGSMFEATSSVSDWTGSAKLSTTVTAEGSDGAVKKFRITPRSGGTKQMFLRIRKEL